VQNTEKRVWLSTVLTGHFLRRAIYALSLAASGARAGVIIMERAALFPLFLAPDSAQSGGDQVKSLVIEHTPESEKQTLLCCRTSMFDAILAGRKIYFHAKTKIPYKN
jgi:hypothetical protein